MHEFGRLQTRTRHAGLAACGHRAQVGINEFGQRMRRLFVAGAPSREQVGHAVDIQGMMPGCIHLRS